MSKIKKENREIIQSYIMTVAKYDFTVDEKRVLSHIIEFLQPLLEGKKLRGRIEQNLFDDYCVEVPLSYFIDDSCNYKRIKDAIIKLNDKKFEYEDENCWQIIRLIEMPKIEKGVVKFCLSSKLVDVFLNFSKGYTKYMLDVSLSFSSVYTMRLYELLAGQQKEITFSIKRLKEMWQIDQMKAYERTNNFIQRVIIPAQKELKEKGTWGFDFKLIRQGRAYSKIQFTPIIYNQRISQEIIHADAIRRNQLSNFYDYEMRKFLINICGFSSREMKNNFLTLKKFATIQGDMVLEKLKTIWERAKDARNPKGYMITSIQNENENY